MFHVIERCFSYVLAIKIVLRVMARARYGRNRLSVDHDTIKVRYIRVATAARRARYYIDDDTLREMKTRVYTVRSADAHAMRVAGWREAAECGRRSEW